MSDYGFKISLPGYDVKTATPEQCAIHSSYPVFKSKVNQTQPHFATLNLQFVSGITQNLTQTVYSIDHGYGYVPFNFASIVMTGVDDFFSPYNITGIGTTGVGANLTINAYCTTTQFLVTVYDNFNWINNTANLQVSYYVFAEDGT